MPVTGEPTPFPLTLLRPRPNKAVREAVTRLAQYFPQPYSYITYIGFNLRKRRLAVELAEFDFMHRLHKSKPASVEDLCRAGEALIEANNGRFPASGIPLDEPLLVNRASFARLLEGDAENGDQPHP